MSGGQPRAELPCDLRGLVLGHAADTAQKRPEVLSVDVLHRQEMVAIDLAQIVHPADVGVRDLPRRSHLVEEALQALLVTRERLGEELESHRQSELQIVRPVDLAHSPFSEEADHPVSRRQHLPGQEASTIAHHGGRPGPESLSIGRHGAGRRARGVDDGLAAGWTEAAGGD